MKPPRLLFIVLLANLICVSGVAQDRRPARVNSDSSIVLAYATLNSHAMLQVLDDCKSDSCRLLAAIDRRMAAEDLSGIAVAIGFAQRIWTFDPDSVGAYHGDLRNTEGQVFISTPIAAWNGDLALVVSAVSPHRVSIIRVAARLGAPPVLTLVFDSISKPAGFGKDRTPIGSVDRLEVVAPERIAVIGNPVGLRDQSSKRPHLISFTANGLEFSRE